MLLLLVLATAEWFGAQPLGTGAHPSEKKVKRNDILDNCQALPAHQLLPCTALHCPALLALPHGAVSCHSHGRHVPPWSAGHPQLPELHASRRPGRQPAVPPVQRVQRLPCNPHSHGDAQWGVKGGEGRVANARVCHTVYHDRCAEMHCGGWQPLQPLAARRLAVVDDVWKAWELSKCEGSFYARKKFTSLTQTTHVCRAPRPYSDGC